MKIFNGAPSDYTNVLTEKLDQKAISWTENASEKETCDVHLYAITPELHGISHIIDLVNDSNHSNSKTIVSTLFDVGENRFNEHQKKSIIATAKMVMVNGGTWLDGEKALMDFLNESE